MPLVAAPHLPSGAIAAWATLEKKGGVVFPASSGPAGFHLTPISDMERLAAGMPLRASGHPGGLLA